MRTRAAVLFFLTMPFLGFSDSTARTVQYHAQDIVAVRARVKYTTLIELPASEKIVEAATGDKDFWIIDVVGSFCFLHPAKSGIRTNLNLITDKGNIYSFTLEDIGVGPGDPDLKIIIQPADQSSLLNASGPAQFVPASEVDALRTQIELTRTQAAQTVDAFKSQYPTQLKFDYHYKSEAPFNVRSIYHDDRFTYLQSDAHEKFTVYEEKDGKPNFVNYELRGSTYVIPKIVDKGYLEIGKKRMEFTRQPEPGVAEQ